REKGSRGGGVAVRTGVTTVDEIVLADVLIPIDEFILADEFILESTIPQFSQMSSAVPTG
ncbi:MAG TPA: hypothetical protein VFB12_09615, partial [Ktedonobacteraceae bacterium]|nr:hypothetical protein [Ktedonobacteraceae bacterium]